MGSCPVNSIRYNGTECGACAVGYLLDRSANRCYLYNVSSSAILTDTGVDYYAISFPETIFAFDSIKKFTQSQAVFLEATLVMLLSWLLFCIFLRFMKLRDGRNVWFKIRWWISRLDICFATRHWLDDQKVVVKRKTELGGTFSIASWILFIGLFAALLYQIISKRTIEVHNVKATNAPDLAAFRNDMEFNITTISSMSCSNLRGLGTVVTGNPGYIDYRVSNLSDVVKYSCWNTSMGPTISFKCTDCRFLSDTMYISWQFFDLPNNPATAVGFQFNLSAKNHDNEKHVSFVSGTLKNGSSFDDTPVTFRGKNANILKFNLFPRIYHNLHDLRLVQPLFHDFLPGSFCRQTDQLRTSLETPADGLINTTLYINYLSAYIVEVENQSIMGPVSFLADLGGLYCFSIGIFFYFLVQSEFRIKKLRNEDMTMRRIRSRLKAQQRWDKLRKYVTYTWGCSTLDEDYQSTQQQSSCSGFMIPPVGGNGSLRGSSRKRGSRNRMGSINFNRKVTLPSEQNALVECTATCRARSSLAGCALNVEGMSDSKAEHPAKGEVHGSLTDGKQHVVSSGEGDGCQDQSHSITNDDVISLPPAPEFKVGSEVGMAEIQKNLQRLYEYNVMLREKLVATQSMLHALASRSSKCLTENQT